MCRGVGGWGKGGPDLNQERRRGRKIREMYRKEGNKVKEQFTEGGLTIAPCWVRVTLGQCVQTDLLLLLLAWTLIGYQPAESATIYSLFI